MGKIHSRSSESYAAFNQKRIATIVICTMIVTIFVGSAYSINAVLSAPRVYPPPPSNSTTVPPPPPVIVIHPKLNATLIPCHPATFNCHIVPVHQ